VAGPSWSASATQIAEFTAAANGQCGSDFTGDGIPQDVLNALFG